MTHLLPQSQQVIHFKIVNFIKNGGAGGTAHLFISVDAVMIIDIEHLDSLPREILQ